MGRTTNRLSKSPAVAVGVLCAALLLALAIIPGCGNGNQPPGEAPTSGGRFSQAIEFGDGTKPSLAATADGWVVEVHEAGKSSTYWSRVGQVKNGAVEWLGSPADSGDGVQPCVAMADDGLGLVVHRAGGTGKSSLWYQVVKFDRNTGELSWGAAYEYDSGANPRVVMFNDGWIVETHESHVGSAAWYKIGQLVEVGPQALVRGSTPVNYKVDFGPTASIDGSRFLAAFKDSDQFIQLFTGGYRFGRIDKQNKTISWMGPSKESTQITGQENKAPRGRRTGNPELTSFSAYTWKAPNGTDRLGYIADQASAGYNWYGDANVVDGMDGTKNLQCSTPELLVEGVEYAFVFTSGCGIEMHKTRAADTLWYSTFQE